LKFNAWKKLEITSIIEDDTRLLEKGNIMDQSLLLGIELNTVFKLKPSSIPGIEDKTDEEINFFKD